jgi:hypothetical protein
LIKGKQARKKSGERGKRGKGESAQRTVRSAQKMSAGKKQKRDNFFSGQDNP